MVKEILLTVFYLLFFNFLLLRFSKLQFKKFKPFVTAALFNIKFITGVLIWFIYTFYYKDVQNNDVHKFYSDAVVLRNVASESPKDFVQLLLGIDKHNPRFDQYYNQMKNWQRNFDEAPFNENQTIIKLNALLMFVSLRVYFVHILFMCFISLVGWVLLVNAVVRFMPGNNALLALPIMLLPSVLFWTSGVMKEPLLVLGLGVLLHGLISLNHNRSAEKTPAAPLPTVKEKLKPILFLFAGALIMLLIKFFVLVCLIPAAFSYIIINQQTKPLVIAVKYAVVNAVLLIIAFNVHYIVPRIDLGQMLVNKQLHSVKEAAYYNAGSRIEIPAMNNDAGSILSTIPAGISNTIFRPYLWDGKNIMMMASAAENVLVLLFIAFCLLKADFKNFKNWNLMLFLFNFSLAYFALIGICTPVLGNLVRYKAPLLPVLLPGFALVVKSIAFPRKLNWLLT